MLAASSPNGLKLPPLRDMPLKLAPLLDLHASEVQRVATSLLTRGYTTFKVKIGIDWKREVAVLHELTANAQAHGRSIVFRLDANQSLARSDLSNILTCFSSLPIDYVEEPCALDDLPINAVLPVRLALDESLQRGHDTLEAWLNLKILAAIVCKPMIVGDLRLVLSWFTQANRVGCQFVVSHLFDGPVAFRLYHALARVLAPDVCHGLFPHAGLELWSDWLQDTPGTGLGLTLTEAALDALNRVGDA